LTPSKDAAAAAIHLDMIHLDLMGVGGRIMACVASDPRWLGFRDSILETLGMSISTRIAQFHQPMHHVRDPSLPIQDDPCADLVTHRCVPVTARSLPCHRSTLNLQHKSSASAPQTAATTFHNY
jgi:hypothetical protein